MRIFFAYKPEPVKIKFINFTCGTSIQDHNALLMAMGDKKAKDAGSEFDAFMNSLDGVCKDETGSVDNIMKEYILRRIDSCDALLSDLRGSDFAEMFGDRFVSFSTLKNKYGRKLDSLHDIYFNIRSLKDDRGSKCKDEANRIFSQIKSGTLGFKALGNEFVKMQKKNRDVNESEEPADTGDEAVDNSWKTLESPSNNVYNEGSWHVYRVDTYEDMRNVASDTEWCVARTTDGRGYFERYKRYGGDYYLFCNGRRNPTFLMHTGSTQFKGTGDIPVSVDKPSMKKPIQVAKNMLDKIGFDYMHCKMMEYDFMVLRRNEDDIENSLDNSIDFSEGEFKWRKNGLLDSLVADADLSDEEAFSIIEKQPDANYGLVCDIAMNHLNSIKVCGATLNTLCRTNIVSKDIRDAVSEILDRHDGNAELYRTVVYAGGRNVDEKYMGRIARALAGDENMCYYMLQSWKNNKAVEVIASEGKMRDHEICDIVRMCSIGDNMELFNKLVSNHNVTGAKIMKAVYDYAMERDSHFFDKYITQHLDMLDEEQKARLAKRGLSDKETALKAFEAVKNGDAMKIPDVLCNPESTPEMVVDAIDAMPSVCNKDDVIRRSLFNGRRRTLEREIVDKVLALPNVSDETLKQMSRKAVDDDGLFSDIVSRMKDNNMVVTSCQNKAVSYNAIKMTFEKAGMLTESNGHDVLSVCYNEDIDILDFMKWAYSKGVRFTAKDFSDLKYRESFRKIESQASTWDTLAEIGLSEIVANDTSRNVESLVGMMREHGGLPESMKEAIRHGQRHGNWKYLMDDNATAQDIDMFMKSGYATGDNSEYVVCALENPNCPEELLRRYATSNEDEYREAVCRNPSAPSDMLRGMQNHAGDFALAGKSGMSDEEIAEILKNGCENAVGRLASDKDARQDILERIFEKYSYSAYVMKMLAANPSTPKELLARLGELANPSVDRTLARNPNYKGVILDRGNLKRNRERRLQSLEKKAKDIFESCTSPNGKFNGEQLQDKFSSVVDKELLAYCVKNSRNPFMQKGIAMNSLADLGICKAIIDRTTHEDIFQTIYDYAPRTNGMFHELCVALLRKAKRPELIEEILNGDENSDEWTSVEIKNIIGFNEYARFYALKYHWDVLDIDYLLSLRELNDEDVDFVVDGILKSLKKNGFYNERNERNASIASRVASCYMKEDGYGF